MIPFQTAVQRSCYEKVLGWMRELFADAGIHVREAAPVIGLVRGSSFTEVGVWAWGEREAVVTARAWVVTRVAPTADLMKFLLQENYTTRFGAFGMDEQGDIVLQHSIIGSTCDRDELHASVLAVSSQADRYDDQIIQRWGGQRAVTQVG